MRTAMIAMLVLAAAASPAAADAVLVGHVTDLLGKPIAGARVHVLANHAEQQTVATDRDGNYRVVVDGDQEISVVIGAGNLHTFRRGAIQTGTIKRLDLEVETTDGEIIRIIDEKPPAVPPSLAKDIPRTTPEYSVESVERDAWAKAWLILDIDATGKVVRVKLLKRPGFDLDAIAVKEAMKLRFDPARDEHGRAMRTQLLWALEWPAHGWLVEHNGTATKLPQESYSINPFGRDFGGEISQATGGPLTPASPLTGASQLSFVPCAGSGPLNLDLVYPVYRDCSKPNLAKADYLPWLDGTQPIPPEPPQFATPVEPPIRGRATDIVTISATAGTAALLTTTLISFVKFHKYSQRLARVSLATNDPFSVDQDQYIRDNYGYHHWQKITLVSAIATVMAGGFTATMWFRRLRKADLSVQPDAGGGGSVTLSGRF